jgi:hypothetical protein
MRLTAFIILIFTGTFVQAQLGKIGDKLLKDKDPLQINKPPITTSLEDAKWEDATKDGFTPRDPERSLMTLQRTPNGGFVLQPGYYSMQTQSYCLKAGTHGPGGGDGYLYAPPLGPMEDIVMSIVRNSVQHPDVHQHDIQFLLWYIIARARYENLDNKIKLVASQLLTPKQLASINRTGLNMIPEAVQRKAIDEAPAPIQAVLRAEAQLRNLLTTTGSSFDDIEKAAVLSGLAVPGPGSRDVPSGRWSLHPDGYFVRYKPATYSSSRVEIWVPQGSSAVGKEYDPATHIAVPGNTARQRLIQSGRQQQQN